ncbi:MAG: hypothetical protein U1F11_11585 [Steroidobacteraceae bacterium]
MRSTSGLGAGSADHGPHGLRRPRAAPAPAPQAESWLSVMPAATLIVANSSIAMTQQDSLASTMLQALMSSASA